MSRFRTAAVALLGLVAIGCSSLGFPAAEPDVPEATVPSAVEADGGDDVSSDGAEGDPAGETTTVDEDENPAASEEPETVDPTALVWAPTGPGGGGAFSAPSIAEDGTMLVGTDLSGAALGRGVSWAVLGANRGLTDTHVSATVFEPGRSDVFLLGTDGGIHRSLDGGTTIERVADGGYTTALAAFGDGRFLAARAPEWNETGTSIWRSEDFGATWSELAAPPRPDAYVLGFRTDLADADHLAAISGPSRFATGAAAVFESLDAGETWRELPLPGPPVDLRQTEDGSWWLTTAVDGDEEVGPTGSVYRSVDLQTWEAVAGDLTGVVVPRPDDGPDVVAVFDLARWSRGSDGAPAVFVDPAGVIDAAVEDGWNAAWSTAPWAFEFGFDGPVRTSTVTQDGELLWVNGQFVHRSDGFTSQPLHSFASDSGWASTGIDNTVAVAFSVSPHDADDVLAGYLDLGLWASGDGGGSWSSQNTSAWTGAWLGAGGNATAVAHDPADPDLAWAALGGDIGAGPVTLLRRSGSVGDRSWRPVLGPVDAEGSGMIRVTDLAVSPETGELAVVADGRVHLAADPATEPLTWRTLEVCSGGCQVIAAAGSGWIAAGPDEVVELRADSAEVVLLVEGAEGEPAWWGPAYAGVSDVAVARDGAEIWVAVTGADGGFWQSTDGGSSWTLALEDGWARGVDVDDRVPGRVIAASSSATLSGGFDEFSTGLRLSLDGGRTFTDANGELPWPFALRAATGPGVVWVVSPGVGLAVADDPLAG